MLSPLFSYILLFLGYFSKTDQHMPKEVYIASKISFWPYCPELAWLIQAVARSTSDSQVKKAMLRQCIHLKAGIDLYMKIRLKKSKLDGWTMLKDSAVLRPISGSKAKLKSFTEIFKSILHIKWIRIRSPDLSKMLYSGSSQDYFRKSVKTAILRLCMNL